MNTKRRRQPEKAEQAKAGDCVHGNIHDLDNQHECPYQTEINDDYDFRCTCCDECAQDCADDI